MDLLAIIGFITLMYCIVYLILPWFLDCDIYLAFKERCGKPINVLHGKVVWITGASSGIGEHLAYVLANVGCKLILSARREIELQKVKETCLKANNYLQPNDIEIIPFDMCEFDMHKKAFDDVINKFGQLDILVDNAGRSQRAQWENIELEVDKQMFDLNVFSVMSLTRLVARYFLQVGKGHIVVTSSLAGILPAPFSATYTASKHALHGYFNSFRTEKAGKRIPVTLVCPGPVQTNFLSECFTEKSGEKFGQNTQMSQTKISAQRCATLMAVAMANELQEVWIAKSVPLQMAYFTTYYYNLGPWLLRLLYPRFLRNVRDDKPEDRHISARDSSA